MTCLENKSLMLTHFHKVTMTTREQSTHEAFFFNQEQVPGRALATTSGSAVNRACTYPLCLERQQGASDARTLEGDKGGIGISIIFTQKTTVPMRQPLVFAKRIELLTSVQNFSFQQHAQMETEC